MALPNQFKSARMTDSTDRATIDTHVGDLEQAICDIFGFTINSDIASGRAIFGGITDNYRPKQLHLEDIEINMGTGGQSGLRMRDSTNDDELKIGLVDGYLMFYENTGTEDTPIWTERTKMDITDGTWSTSLGFHGARVYNTSNQDVTLTTETALNADAEVFDTDTYHDNVTDKTRITIPTTLNGYHLVVIRVSFVSCANAGDCYLRLKKNGTTDIAEEKYYVASTIPQLAPAFDMSTIVELAGDDFIEVVIYHTANPGPATFRLREFSATLLGQ